MRQRLIEFRFLSTLSLRRATNCTSIGRPKRLYFYPRSPCGERHCTSIGRPKRLYFYPRSPCGERRQLISIRIDKTQFLSTLSLRRATMEDDLILDEQTISIHALLAESDQLYINRPTETIIFLSTLLAESDEHAYQLVLWVLRFLSTLSLRRATTALLILPIRRPDFYPRSPCGERRILSTRIIGFSEFLSTLSLRRATQ